MFLFDLEHQEPAWERHGRGGGARADVEQHVEVVWFAMPSRVRKTPCDGELKSTKTRWMGFTQSTGLS